MIDKMFDVICKQQGIALDTKVETIDPDVLVDFIVGLEDILGLKVNPHALHTLEIIADLKRYFEQLAIERSAFICKVC